METIITKYQTMVRYHEPLSDKVYLIRCSNPYCEGDGYDTIRDYYSIKEMGVNGWRFSGSRYISDADAYCPCCMNNTTPKDPGGRRDEDE